MNRPNPYTIFIAVAVLAVGAATADEGRIPIFNGTAIDAPGHYVLTRDISATTGPVIQILADGVTLDLGGNSVALSDPDSPPVLVDLSGVTGPKAGVAIRNGRIDGGLNGIHVTGFAPRISLRRVQISGSTGYGVRWDVAGSSEDSTVFEMQDSGVIDATDGLLLADPRPSPLCAVVVVGSLFDGILGDAVSLEGCPDGKIKGNEILGFGKDGNPAAGIKITGASPDATPVIADNTISRGGAQAAGIWIGGNLSKTDFLLTGNTVTHNGGRGMVILGGTGRIAGNTISSNGGDGIRVEGGDSILVESNYSGDNGEYGIYFGNTQSHAYRDNFLRSNRTGTVGGEVNTDAGGNIE
jgi:parallel beta-helix repeat protein